MMADATRAETSMLGLFKASLLQEDWQARSSN